MKYYLKALDNYANFRGRATRSEFWYFTLINTILWYGIGVFGGVKDIVEVLYFWMFYSLILLTPMISISVRRMHDVGKSGWYILVPFYNIYLLAKASDSEENKYGQVLVEIKKESKTIPYIKPVVTMILLIGLTLPFHYIPSRMMMFPKNQLTFSYTFITQSDIDNIIDRYNNSGLFERQAINNEPIVRKLKEMGIIQDRDDEEEN